MKTENPLQVFFKAFQGPDSDP